jgi:sterol desaturase/sphingolipid hydroxylase (fatty acid hydroxylase superfamily)
MRNSSARLRTNHNNYAQSNPASMHMTCCKEIGWLLQITMNFPVGNPCNVCVYCMRILHYVLFATDTMATRQRYSATGKVEWNFPLTRTNLVILAIGIAIIAAGYLLMLTAITDDPAKHQEVWNNPMAVTLSPILLVIGYAIVIPIALLYRPKSN